MTSKDLAMFARFMDKCRFWLMFIALVVSMIIAMVIVVAISHHVIQPLWLETTSKIIGLLLMVLSAFLSWKLHLNLEETEAHARHLRMLNANRGPE